jgi:16S rRNA (cytosine967-C5)-methyltransferase
MHRVQRLAIGVLAKVEAGKTLTESLSALFHGDVALTPAERGALQDICYGVLRHRSRLHYGLRRLVPKPVADAQIEQLLLVALYQLLYTRAADYAVVNETVTGVGRYKNGRFKGLCNAVLRNALRQREGLLAGIEQDDEAYYSHPRWWIATLQSAYPTQWQTILAINNQHPPMVIRVNCRKITPAAYLAELGAVEIAAVAIDDAAIRLVRPMPVQALPGFASGLLSVQDWGAQQAAHRLDVRPGLRVLDACAAPGGKTCHILELVDAKVVALDISESRLVRVRENLQRLDLDAQLMVADVRELDKWWDGQLFDRILADVPCSASGVVRRHPDIKWLRSAQELSQLVKQQADIMDTLWRILASGGKMLYATCSVFPKENSMQLAAFLTRHSDVKCVDQEQLLPSESHDGFYYALLEKQ